MQNIAYLQGNYEVKSHTYLMVSYAVVEVTCVGPWNKEKNVSLVLEKKTNNGEHHPLIDELEQTINSKWDHDDLASDKA